jgi:hypothetical protein
MKFENLKIKTFKFSFPNFQISSFSNLFYQNKIENVIQKK